MIQPTLPVRYNNQDNTDFTIYEISLVDGAGDNCGVVSYVRMGNPQNDTLDMLIFESIKHKYPLSSNPKTTLYFTRQANPNQFSIYNNVAKLFIGIKNYTGYDPAYAVDNINTGLAIHLDIYNPIEGLVYDDINYFSRVSQQELSNACNEENKNLETYNTFIR